MATTLDEQKRNQLIDAWLPRLRAIREQRQPTVRLMRCILITPFIVSLIIASSLIFNQDALFFKSGAGILLMGVAAIAFVYLGKLQSCNDVTLAIEMLVYIGDGDALVKSLFSNISCLGNMGELIADTRNVLHSLPK